MKRFLFLTLLLTSPLFAQNQVGVFAIGNFNPAHYIQLNTQGGQLIVSSMSDEMGGGAEYRRTIGPDWQVGLLYLQDEVQAKLFWSTAYSPNTGVTVGESVWPLMRYEADVLVTRNVPAWHKITPFLQGGPGWIVTDSLVKNSGWSHNFAFVSGYGFDYAVTKRITARVGTTLDLARTGCYGDHTCNASWAVAQNLRAGFVFSW